MLDLKNTRLVLGSKSPRRQELLKGLGLTFELRTKDTAEDYSDTLDPREVPAYLAEIKADALFDSLAPDELLITSDTIVLIDNEILGKPEDAEHAVQMLQQLSGRPHEVVTGVHLRSHNYRKSFSVTTKVFFKPLTEAEIRYYVENYRPFDKAGAYGIQEWIGYVAIEKIEGSHFNVMGLPVAELWEELEVAIAAGMK